MKNLNNNWIDINKELPECSGKYSYSVDVKAITKNGIEVNGHFELESLQFYVEEIDGYLLLKDKVTHWKPLVHTPEETNAWDNTIDG